MTVTSAETARAGRPGGDIPPAVRLRGLHQSFGPVEAVRGIDLTIAAGEVVAFLGPNGAGKTSTIDIILGLSRPSQRRGGGLRPGAPAAIAPGPGLGGACRPAGC